MMNFVVGIKQTHKALTSGKAKQCYVACDAQEHLTKNIVELCKENSVPLVYVDTMKELGTKFKVSVGAASAAELRGE